MVKINKIYTRTGDKGETGLVGGQRINKDSLRVDAFGDVDELNAYLGYARTLAEQEKRSALIPMLAKIENDLFDLGSELATPPDSEWDGMSKISTAHINQLEVWVDQLIDGLPELRSFTLPGGTILNSILHIARTVCRRAERNIVRLSKSENVSNSILVYCNRLSDLLFAMARYESNQAGVPEYLWKPGGKQ